MSQDRDMRAILKAFGLVMVGIALSYVMVGSVAWMAEANANPPTAGGVVVPYYGAQYGQPGGFSQADARRVVDLLASIDNRLANLEAAAGVGPQAAVKPDVLKVAAQHCASCHTPSAAEKSGKGFVLFADDEARSFRFLSLRDQVRVREAVLSGHMPPKGNLSAAEKAAFEE